MLCRLTFFISIVGRSMSTRVASMSHTFVMLWVPLICMLFVSLLCMFFPIFLFSYPFLSIVSVFMCLCGCGSCVYVCVMCLCVHVCDSLNKNDKVSNVIDCWPQWYMIIGHSSTPLTIISTTSECKLIKIFFTCAVTYYFYVMSTMGKIYGFIQQLYR